MILSQGTTHVNGTANQSLAGLTPRHLEDLRRSGLSDQQIAACGFHSLQAPASIQKALRWARYKGELGDCLAIPFCDVDGKRTEYRRLKPDTPRKKDGKPIKYEAPKGLPNLPFIPPGTLTALKDPTAPLIITEGEKKAAAADQHGFATVGLTGVWAWQKKRAKDKDGNAQGERELIDGLASIIWRGRIVYIIFDSDAADNAHVRQAEWELAQVVARLGAIVKVVRLPTGAPGSDSKLPKVGLDDFLVAHGPDALRELLATAMDAQPPPKALEPNEAGDDPHRLARIFVSEQCQHADGLTLRFWRDEWHRWNEMAWHALPDKELRAELTASAKAEMDRVNLIAQKLAEKDKPPPTVRKVTGRLIADVAHALQSVTILPSHTEAPTWLYESGPFPAADILPCRNGLVYLPGLVAGQDYFHRPTPRFFSPNALDYDFDPEAPRPAAWLDFLGQLWPNDPQSIGTLQEWTGYLLIPDTHQQKILMLVGPKRSGKGTIARVIRGLIGLENMAGPTLSSLGEHFGLQPLLGKTVAMIQDARLSGRSDMATITERLLSLSGEDALTIPRKFLADVTAKLSARFMILTNELPKLGDASGALTGRIVLLRLTESWYGREDTRLTDRLLAEMPGILLWAIAGWQRLRDRGHFTQPDAAKELLGQLENLSSPVGAFVRERCKTGPGCTIEKARLYESWKAWCQEQGRDHPGDSATFGRNLRAVLPNLGEGYPRVGDSRVYVYEGITLA